MASTSGDRFRLRSLQAGDFRKGHVEVLAQLSQVGNVDEAAWQERFQVLSSQQDVYKIMVIEDTTTERIVATATLLIELKFLRSSGKCGHIEDVVVDNSCRGYGLGLRLIQRLVDLAEEAGCYKVILDCAESNAAFYAKAGLARKEVQMAKYF